MRDEAAEERMRGFFAKLYRRQGRAYPWRDRGVSAYRILIAEIMLRKTQADRVVSPWLEFTSRFSSPSACLESNDLDRSVAYRPAGPVAGFLGGCRAGLPGLPEARPRVGSLYFTINYTLRGRKQGLFCPVRDNGMPAPSCGSFDLKLDGELTR